MFASLIEVLTAFFKFPAATVELIRVLSKTPEEKHQELIAKVNKAFDESANGGRPG